MNRYATALLVVLGFSTIPVLAADDSFVGKWKFDPDKSQLSGLQYKIDDAGGGKFRFAFGDDVETMTLDGKEHTTKFGNTWSIKTTGRISWESTIKRDGKVISTSKWSLSEDGQNFLSIDEEIRPDGSTGRTEAMLKRTSGTSGIAGSWESSSVKVLSPITIEIANWKKDGYSLLNPTNKERLDFRLDGKNYVPVGPRVAKGAKVSARKIDDRTVELTYKLKGKMTETDRWELSGDGKMLTNTITYAGMNKPEVDVYNRQ